MIKNFGDEGVAKIRLMESDPKLFRLSLLVGEEAFLSTVIAEVNRKQFPRFEDGYVFMIETRAVSMALSTDTFEEWERIHFAQDVLDEIIIPFCELLFRLWPRGRFDSQDLVELLGKLSCTESNREQGQDFTSSILEKIENTRKLVINASDFK